MYEKLNETFKNIAVKYLSKVDASPAHSNQHEIGGLKKAGIAEHLGYPQDGQKKEIPATLVYLSDDDIVTVEDKVTWYDTRFNNPDRSAEYRLYYTTNEVTNLFQEGDFFLIAVTRENRLLMLFTEPESDIEIQLRAIFGIQEKTVDTKLSKVTFDERSIVIPVRLLLEEIGIDISPVFDNRHLDEMLELFGRNFPKTKPFSEFARRIHGNEAISIESPDEALVSWMDTEEALFRTFEREIVKEKLKEGFGPDGHDVDEFVSFSLSVHNRRKSRVGHAFENHIERILQDHHVKYERGARTEGKKKPDFLFPGSSAYSNPEFNNENLRILGAKTTCKDRWRQVLSEADRIKRKHLITLQPSISEDQLNEMKEQNLQLVVPMPLHPTFTERQREWLYSFKNFISEVKACQ